LSSLSLEVIGETARNRLSLPPNEAPRLITMVPGALKSLALKVARRSDFETLRKEINVNCAAGVITLADATLLVQVLLETGELILDGKVAKAAPSYHDLTLKMPTDVYRWSLRAPSKIYVTDLVTGALGTVNKAGTLTFNYTPTLAEMPDSLDKELLDEVVILGSGKVEKSPAQPFGQEGQELNVSLNSN